MSTIQTETRVEGLGLSRSQAWVLHHVLADRIDGAHEADERPPWWAVEVIGKLEAQGECGPTASDQHSGAAGLTCFEAWRVRQALLEYAETPTTPDSDAAAARWIVDHIDSNFEAPPATLLK
jgi:hypothetical protein